MPCYGLAVPWASTTENSAIPCSVICLAAPPRSPTRAAAGRFSQVGPGEGAGAVLGGGLREQPQQLGRQTGVPPRQAYRGRHHRDTVADRLVAADRGPASVGPVDGNQREPADTVDDRQVRDQFRGHLWPPAGEPALRSQSSRAMTSR